MNIKIDLPATVTVTSRGQSVDVDVSALSADIVARLVVHGLTQKVADAASNAKAVAAETDGETPETVTVSLMQKAVAALVAGEWAQRTGGDGVDERTRVARSVVQAAVKTKWGAKSANWIAFTKLGDAEQAAKLDGWYEANEADFAPTVDAELKARADKRAAKAKLASAVNVTL